MRLSLQKNIMLIGRKYVKQDNKKQIDIYDYKEVYEEEILPHIKEVMRVCRQYRIPVFLTIPIQNKENETTYETEILTPGSEGICLYQDNIRKIVMVQADIEQLAIQEEDTSITF